LGHRSTNNADGSVGGHERELIALAEKQYHLQGNAKVGEFEDCLVILVAKPTSSNVYERLRIGAISKESWVYVQVRNKTIILE
jgi:hypothetical protein